MPILKLVSKKDKSVPVKVTIRESVELAQLEAFNKLCKILKLKQEIDESDGN